MPARLWWYVAGLGVVHKLAAGWPIDRSDGKNGAARSLAASGMVHLAMSDSSSFPALLATSTASTQVASSNLPLAQPWRRVHVDGSRCVMHMSSWHVTLARLQAPRYARSRFLLPARHPAAPWQSASAAPPHHIRRATPGRLPGACAWHLLWPWPVPAPACCCVSAGRARQVPSHCQVCSSPHSPHMLALLPPAPALMPPMAAIAAAPCRCE